MSVIQYHKKQHEKRSDMYSLFVTRPRLFSCMMIFFFGFFLVCRSDEVLFSSYCISTTDSPADVATASMTCKKSRNSVATLQNLNRDLHAFLILAAFLHKEPTIIPSVDTVKTCFPI
jgi:hypothetical protein